MIQQFKKNTEIIWNLSLNDFSMRYAGSMFGIFWAFAQPVITILVYACVFQFGLNSKSPIPGVSYIFWFAAGMIPWFFFSDGVRAVTNSLLEYGYLVKKVVFEVSFLPVIKIISSLFVHLVFIILLFLIALFNRETLSIYAVQIMYYLICTIALVYVFGKITSAVILFFRDLGQIVNIVLDIGLWATPVIWPYQIVPEQYDWIVKINPVFYLVEGYRDSLINRIWFFEKPVLTIGFWVGIIVLGLFSKYIFDKLRPQFADVI